MMRFILITIFLVFFMQISVFAQEPSLPLGLGGNISETSEEPALPTGLGNMVAISDEKMDKEKTHENIIPFGLTGFMETRAGARIHNQEFEKKASIGETRLQLQWEKYWGDVNARITSDFIADPVADRWNINLDNGDGWIDLREAFVSWHAADFMDIKAGRQILTWGTGDLVFLNDLFPKDFDSFFIGRDEEYLKAPSDSIKSSFFSDFVNLDIIYTPNFDADRFADGARISTYDPFTGGQTSRKNILNTDTRGRWFAEDEWAARLYKNFGAYETALYGYYGYWKNPQGLDSAERRATYPRLSVYGASIRGPIAKGIGNIELSYYDSRDDNKGDIASIPNNQIRFLIGYEQELMTDFTGGVQYYLENIRNFDDLKRTAIAGSPLPEENRHLITLRLTKYMMNQNLELSLFNFWSPNESDGYIRPKINYKINDQWTAETGGNIFYGESRDTFFGQLEDNTNIYLSLRYSF